MAGRAGAPARPAMRPGSQSPELSAPSASVAAMITAADVREVALSLPRTEEHLIREHIKFRVGKIVYASVSPDEATLGVGFPKEERAALVASQPDVFLMPRLSDQRFHWINARMAALSPDELRELVTDAWRMVVPKKVAAALDHPVT
jgi:hypothetical protein